MRLVLRAAAVADLEDAQSWYNAINPALGDSLVAAVDVAMNRALSSPESAQVVHRDTRRVLVHRFPYAVYFRIVGSQVVVVAIIHGRRDPRHWKRRR